MTKISKFIKKYTLLEWLLACIFLGDNGWWFLWGYGLSGYVWMACALLVILMMRKKVIHSRNLGAVFLSFMYFVLFQIVLSGGFHISSVLISILLAVCCQLSLKQSVSVLELLTHYVAMTVAISLPAWVVHQFIYPLPMLGEIDIGMLKTGVPGSVIMENHGLFVMSKGVFAAYRFYGPFDEPGVLGTLAPLLLWANNYNFKKIENVIIFIGSLCTFSMAFYILFIVGVFLKSGLSVKKIFLGLVIILASAFIMVNLFSANEGFQQVVVNRFVNYEDYGTDHRTTYDVNLYWEQFMESSDVIFGKGGDYMQNEFGGGGASYKNFIIEYGIVGVIILIFAYLSMSMRRNKFVYLTLFLFLLSFLQRPYMFTGWQVLLFAITIKTGELYADSNVRNVRHV